MTNEELDAIAQRLAEFNCDATLPLAVSEDVNPDGNYTLHEMGGGWIADVFTKEIAAFFAAAPADVPVLVAEVRRLHGELEAWQVAFGLLTTLGGDFEIDIRDPLGMARAIERHVLAERAALAAATARAEAAERDARDVRAWADAVPVEAIRRYFYNSAALLDMDYSAYSQIEAAGDSEAVGVWLEQSEVQP